MFWTTEFGGSVAGLHAECLGFGFYWRGPEKLEQSDRCHHHHHPVDTGELTFDPALLPTEGISAFFTSRSSRAFFYNITSSALFVLICASLLLALQEKIIIIRIETTEEKKTKKSIKMKIKRWFQWVNVNSMSSHVWHAVSSRSKFHLFEPFNV